jgi:hypothetical protein
MSLRHQFIPNEPAAQTSSKPKTTKPATKPTTAPVAKIETSSVVERIEPPEPVNTHAVNVHAVNVHCPTCGQPIYVSHTLEVMRAYEQRKAARQAYQRDYMRARRARKKAQE